MSKEKKRLDELVCERGLAPNIQKARALIMAGEIMIDDQSVSKAGMQVRTDIKIKLKNKPKYVSRGGVKLAGALADFSVDPVGMVCADVGASTGGFTDCLLQQSANKVYAIDVGYGILAHRIRTDERVVVMERTNARYVESLPELVDLVVVDASFISLSKLIPIVKQWLKPQASIIALIKPQFEADQTDILKGGLVTDTTVHKAVIHKISNFMVKEGLNIAGLTTSPLTGAKSGNSEFFIWVQKGTRHPTIDVDLALTCLF